MFERRNEPLLSRREFLQRQARFTAFAAAIILGSLLVGMLGYHFLEGLAWVDAFLNAAMILGGMGPVSPVTTTAGKIFAGLYALYSGIIFLVSVGVLLLPVLHRVLHSFHIDTEDDDSAK